MWTLKEIEVLVSGRRLASAPDAPVKRIGLDSRTLEPGDLFCALIGPRFDAHAFLEQAYRAGAVGALVERAVDGSFVQPSRPWTVFQVQSTYAALAALAKAARRRASVRCVAVTGSCGKSTTKEMIAAVLSTSAPTLKSPASFNNHVGVPQTLLALEPFHRWAVLELGSNHPGEIRSLAQTACPDWAVITNVGPAHLEGFGSLETVYQEKLSLAAEIPDDGVVIVFGDDPHLLRDLTALNGHHRRITFGFSRGCDIRAETVIQTMEGTQFRVGGMGEFRLSLLGQHNVANALAAIAVGKQAGLSPDEIRRGLDAVQPLPHRLQLIRTDRGTFLDDSYNANPLSLYRALAALKELPTPAGGRRIVALGDMLELGAASRKSHEQAGRWVHELGFDILVTVGTQAQYAAEEAVRAGMDSGKVFSFETVDALTRFLEHRMEPRDIVLLKGSRRVEMEKALACSICS